MLPASLLQAQAPLATAKPTALNVTVTKVELWNGSTWIEVFTGSAQLDLVAGGTFPGIADVRLPLGTYSKVRVTVLNSFGVTGTITNLGTTYFVSSADGPPGSGTSAATVSAASAGPYSFFNPAWGAAGAAFLMPEFTITPVTVSPSTNYAPSLKFDVTNALELRSVGPVFYFTMAVPTVSIIIV
jgi:hypothetical protein